MARAIILKDNKSVMVSQANTKPSSIRQPLAVAVFLVVRRVIMHAVVTSQLSAEVMVVKPPLPWAPRTLTKTLCIASVCKAANRTKPNTIKAELLSPGMRLATVCV